MRTSKSKLFLKKARALKKRIGGFLNSKGLNYGVFITLVFVAVLSSVAGATILNTSQNALVEPVDTTKVVVRQSPTTPETPVSKVDASATQTTTSADTVKSTPVPSPNPTKSAPVSAQAAPGSYVQPPFTVSSVVLQNAFVTCGGITPVVYIESAVVREASGRGGSLSWRIEVSGGFDSYDGYTQTSSLPQGSTYLTLSAPNQPGFLFSKAMGDNQSVRIHVTSPNDIASAWFTVPSGTQQSCS